MTEDPAQLAREAKSLQQTLKDSLKTKDPWDRETDFTRKQLRRSCLRLLLLHPYAPESKDAENQLWMQTSYAFISVYKQRITTLDRAIHNTPRQHQQPQGQAQAQGQQQGRGHGGHGVVEYRKLLQRFRQYLADEEKFWIQLIVRIRRIFHLEDAQNVLSELGLAPDEPPVENGPPKRNHFQFPSETDIAAAAPSLTPSTREQRESRLAILSKALVCLGDIERYKEQYNEAGGRPRAGHEDGPPAAGANGNAKGGRGKKGAPPVNSAQPLMPRMRNYDKAQQCYQQARLLLPQDGNPAHQMAILASYQKDVFNSLVHYYRALCVRSPYDTAAENLGTVLSKTLEQWKTRGAKREKEREKDQARGEATSMAPRLRVEAFKEKLIVLHALWRISPEEAEAITPNLSNKLADDFKSLVTERVLPLDIISRAIVLAQGALWKHRMFRTASLNGHKKGPSPAAYVAIESSIAGHLLLFHRVLLEVGIAQMEEAPPEDAGESDLAQHITAAFRRTLPALRIASKWLRANLRYVTQASQASVAAESEVHLKTKGRDRRRGGDRRSTSLPLTLSIPGVPEFWRTYAQFSSILCRVFPADKLPQLTTLLEEDIEMAGFLPLKKFAPEQVVGTAIPNKENSKPLPNGPSNAGFQTILPEQVHPNEEQLMRIADLLTDAQAIADDEGSPLTLSDNNYTTKGLPDSIAVRGASLVFTPSHAKRPPQGVVSTPISHEFPPIDPEEDAMTDITRTEDDFVEQVMRTVLQVSHQIDDDDEDDEIVLDLGLPKAQESVPIPSTSAVPQASPPRHLISSPVVPALSPRSLETTSPNFVLPANLDRIPPVLSPSNVTTAQDILTKVLRPSPPKGDLSRPLHLRNASAPQTHLLFGSSPLNGGHSIWSSSESSGLSFQGAAGTTNGPAYQSYQLRDEPHSSALAHPVNPPLNSGHPLSSLGSTYQYNSMPALSGGSGHQRVHSLLLARSQMPSSMPSTQFSDSIGSYPAFTEQVPISYNTGVPGAFADPVFSRQSDSSYIHHDASAVHNRSVPYHFDPRRPTQGGAFPPPLSSMAQLWNNAG